MDKPKKKNPPEPPEIQVGDWIILGRDQFDYSRMYGYVLRKYSDTEIEVGYYQEKRKAIGDDMIWNGERWEFKYPGPSGRYLRGSEERIVKEGPSPISTIRPGPRDVV